MQKKVWEILNRKAEITETIKNNPMNMKQWEEYFQMLYQNDDSTDLMAKDNEPEDMLAILDKDIYKTSYTEKEEIPNEFQKYEGASLKRN